MYTFIAKLLVIASVATLFIKGIFTGMVKPDVFFILGSAFCIGIAILKKELVVDWKKFSWIITVSAIMVISIIIGSIVSLATSHMLIWHNIFIEYKILFGCLLIFFEIIILGHNDLRFLKWLVMSFLVSLTIVVAPYLPLEFRHYFVEGTNRFKGLLDVNFYTSLMVLPTITIFYLMIKEKLHYKNLLRLISFFIIFSLSVGLIIWTGTRSGWLGFTIGILVFIFISTKDSQKKLKHFVILMAVFVSGSILGYILLPKNVTVDIHKRFEYITTPPPPEQINNTVKTIPLIDNVSHNQDRLNIWKNGMSYIIKNPLGYGLDYVNIINIGGIHIGIHSLPLELLLVGGIALFVSFSYLVFSCIKQFLLYQKKGTPVDLYAVLFASLIGVLICMLFLSSLLIRWLWIQVAIMLAWHLNNTRELSLKDQARISLT